MKQTALIALLALASFTALPVAAADAPEAALAPEAAVAAAPENLSVPGKPCNKPCNKPGMGGMGMGGMQGMGGMMGMMGGDGRACPKSSCDCKHHADMGERVQQLEKRLDALQMTLEMLVRQQSD